MNKIPKDPVMLLSYVNTQLRDFYHNLDDFCSSLNLNKEEIIQTIRLIDYEYDIKTNQFV